MNFRNVSKVKGRKKIFYPLLNGEIAKISDNDDKVIIGDLNADRSGGRICEDNRKIRPS